MFFFDRNLNSFAVSQSQAGQVSLTLLGLLQLFVKPGTDVVVRTGTDAEKVH